MDGVVLDESGKDYFISVIKITFSKIAICIP
ncbi:hypothetical protein T11_4456 [Trichinella zimbabwensis]|uniref:Uncharacterized protein n=1 Tax=Trichinella zimbabwensis TaxID=268475 RepID=A0A0V1FCQ9_9BILA|nr:hypothetical protein T11_4456 [Trichinella zimbabwensis]